MTTLTVKPLSRNNPQDLQAVTDLCLAAPDYARIVYGRPPIPEDAVEIFDGLPAGVRPEAKLVAGLFLQDALVGCLEMLRGYPAPDCAYIGLLLFAEASQRRGLGSQAMAWADATAAAWGCARIRLAVIETNVAALAFWARHGFVQVHRKDVPGTTGPAVVMERKVIPPSAAS